MPRYFFNFVTDGAARPDYQGQDLADHQSARDQAVRACGEMLLMAVGRLAASSEWRMDVDLDGEPIVTVSFSETFHAR